MRRPAIPIPSVEENRECMSQPPRGGISGDVVVWNDRDPQSLRIAFRCGHCGGEWLLPEDATPETTCKPCRGAGWYGIDPHWPTTAIPGSLEKIAVLSTRCSASLPLWHTEDGGFEGYHPIEPVHSWQDELVMLWKQDADEPTLGWSEDEKESDRFAANVREAEDEMDRAVSTNPPHPPTGEAACR